MNNADEKQLNCLIEKNTKEFGSVLCHYTSLEAACEIIKNKEIWLSDKSDLNDVKEVYEFVDRIKDGIGEYDKIGFFDRVEGLINNTCQFVFSLSRERDDASQWERYGDSAKGVAMLFRVEELTKLLYCFREFEMNEVFYDWDIKNNDYYELTKRYLVDGILEVYSSEEELIKYIISAGLFHKHPSFRHENEIRVSCEGNDVLKNHKPYYQADYEFRDKKCKQVIKVSTEAMGVELGVPIENLIDKIVLGPRSQQNDRLLGQYLSYSTGCLKWMNKIERSDCPLR